MPYCSMHLTDYALGTMCPECRREQAREAQQELIELQRESQREAENQREELIASIREAEHKRFNPGDYQCNACLLKTLLYGASRCPVCRADVGPDYWSSVYAREERAKEAAAVAKKNVEDAKKRVCDAAVALVKLGMAHTEHLWEVAFREAKKRQEDQRGLSRLFAPLKPPAERYICRFQITESSASNGMWAIQPVLILGIRTPDTDRWIGFKHYRFGTPFEYVAVFHYLKTREAWNMTPVTEAITLFQRWLSQDWPIREPHNPMAESRPQNHTESLQRHRRGAAQEDATSQYELGRMYALGEGVTRDFEEALKWYRRAADQGHAGAHRNIGVMHARGEAVSKDYAEAMKWYRKAADLGDIRAGRFIGVMYANGEGVSKDFGEAMKWYRWAADQDDAWATLNIGRMYHYGQGVVQNDHNALMWYRKAAELADNEAAFNARFYIDLIGGKFDR